MAEAAATTTGNPNALDDLDVPYRFGCCMTRRDGYGTGKPLGE